MGRPLNKKYFGNRNIGSTSVITDDNIGGEGIASVGFSNQGNFAANGTSTPLVGLSLPAPSIPTGVQATGTITYEVSTVTTGAGIGSLVVGAVYSYGTAPNFPECGNARWSVATTPGGGNATFTVTNRGTGIASIPTDTITVNMTKVSGSGPTNFSVDVWFRVKSFVIVEKGSGYTGDETITVTLGANAAGSVPVGAIVLTADTGGEYSGDNVGTVKGKNVSTYNENAIIAIDVSDDSIVDIIKQEGARRFKVKTATTTKFLNLTAPDDSTGLFIKATDSDGYDYWVKKISGHKATLIKYQPGGNARFADNTAVHWTFDAPTATTVKIRNA